jgi:hypothetical protein
MAHAFCQILIIGIMPVGRYSVGIKVSDYIKGNPNPMSTVPVKFLIDIIPIYQTACLSRFVLFLTTIKYHKYIYILLNRPATTGTITNGACAVVPQTFTHQFRGASSATCTSSGITGTGIFFNYQRSLILIILLNIVYMINKL